ncbi:hypothetical protein HDR60_03785 [bacterium]|nr:hypothetical protein [bacterium]
MKKNTANKENAISFFDAYVKMLDEKAYKEEIEALKDKNGHLHFRYGKWKPFHRYDILIKELKRIMERYHKDGQDIYEQFVAEINETNYPTEIKEKLLADIKNDLFSKPSENKEENKKENKKEIKEIENLLTSLHLPKYLFNYGLYDCVNPKEAIKKLSPLSLDMQKKIVRNYGNVLEFFENPSKELCLYTIKEKDSHICRIPEKYQNDLDIQLAIIEKTSYFPVKKIKLLPQARIEYIKKYPEEIIREITKFNYNQEERLTIYDLNKEELEIYQQSIEKYFVNKVKNDPIYIKEIKNPSAVIKETALKAFKEQYTR